MLSRNIDLVHSHSSEAVEFSVSPPEKDGEAEPLYAAVLDYITQTLADVRNGGMVDTRRGSVMANALAAQLRTGNDLLRPVFDRGAPFSLAVHLVNVCIIATAIAQNMKWPADRVHRVALASLLHDIGVTCLSDDGIWNEHDFGVRINPQIRQVPQYSADLLSSAVGFELVRQIILQAGELENGSDHSSQRRAGTISEEVMVLGAANVLETLLHRRNHRDAKTGLQALGFLLSPAIGFPEWVVKAVVSSFSIYPLGEYVLLNTGEAGVVQETNPNKLRPIVSVICSPEGTALSTNRIVDLSGNANIWIVSAIPRSQVPCLESQPASAA